MIDASAALPFAAVAPRAARAGAPDTAPVAINEHAGGRLASPVELLAAAGDTLDVHAAKLEVTRHPLLCPHTLNPEP